jgi:hypothetical protein
MTDDLLDTPVSPADQGLAARLTLAALDGDPDRVKSGLLEMVGAGADCAVAGIGLLTRHLAVTLVSKHGEEKARAMLQKVILDAGEAGQRLQRHRRRRCLCPQTHAQPTPAQWGYPNEAPDGAVEPLRAEKTVRVPVSFDMLGQPIEFTECEPEAVGMSGSGPASPTPSGW